MKKLFYSFLAIVFLFSCAPSSKDTYIADYKKFINRVSDEYKTYNEKDWDRAQRKLDKFSGEWYDKFSTELSTKEKITVTGYKAKFNYLCALGKSGNAINDIVDSFKENGGSELEEYVDEELEDDINDVVKEAEKVGKDLLDYIEEWIDEVSR